MGPLRRCALSGERHPAAGLLRFVLDREGALQLDALHVLGGRGLWMKPERDLLSRLAAEKSAERRALSRAARRMVRVPDGIVSEIEQALRACLAGLEEKARRSGAEVLASTPLGRRVAMVRQCLAGVAALPQG